MARLLMPAFFVRRLEPREGLRAPLLVGEAAALVCSPSLLLLQDATQIWLTAAWQVGAACLALSTAPSMLQLMAPRRIRARVICLDGMLGLLLLPLSPVVVGALSDAMDLGPRPPLVVAVCVRVVLYVGSCLCLVLARPTLLPPM